LLSKVIFIALVALMVVAAIPYGTVEPWWKAAFVCAVFVICIVAIVERLVRGEGEIAGGPILLPLLALALLAFAQTLSLGSREAASLEYDQCRSLSNPLLRASGARARRLARTALLLRQH
jgi:hypothetical protein